MTSPCGQCRAAWDLQAIRRYDLAEKMLREVLDGMSWCATAHAKLAYCLMRQERHDEAMIEAKEAVRLGPNESFCHGVMGLIFAEKDFLLDAEASMLEAVRLNPQDVTNHYRLAELVGLRLRNWERCLSATEEGLAIAPAHSGCSRLRAYSLAHLGHYDLALPGIREALKLDPQSPHAHAMLGWMLLQQGEPQNAIEHFEEALRLDPDYAWARAHYQVAKSRASRPGTAEVSSRSRSDLPPAWWVMIVLGVIPALLRSCSETSGTG